MKKTCLYCNTELPISSTKFGVEVPGKKYCDKCLKKRTFVLQKIRDNKIRLNSHYELLKRELKIIEEIKDLINLGEDEEARVKEYIETNHGFWEKYDHQNSYNKPKDNNKFKQEEYNNKPLPGENNDK